jgi:hypothetical protein
MSKLVLSDANFIKALVLKAATTATVFSVGNKFINKLNLKDGALMRGFISSFTSSALAEIVMASVVQRIIAMYSGSNQGITRIFDSAANASLSAIINNYGYKKLVAEASDVSGNVFTSQEEFYLQFGSDAVAEMLSMYLVPLFGLGGSGVQMIYP